MSDIFISYSSKDREQAQLLTELLASAGLSVWIDQAGIGAATSWSGEISKAITDCKALIVLLSPSSVDSKNVTREVALAFERNKKILPIDIEPVALPDDFAYHLAGIQRAPMTNIDSIIRALGKLGLEATGAPQAPKIVREQKSDRKTLMILPFEDLSPTGDNQWFADGIVSELINALSGVKALRTSDAQATKDYKRYQGTLPAFAREMGIRYFLQGDVRKFGDQIKISVRLLDIETGDHLWQDSLKGTMDDIFDIQEKVAEKVVEGLKVHLASGEKERLAERGTENAEAYELFVKANGYFFRQTQEGLRLALSQLTLALELDPNYARALHFKSLVLAMLYQHYVRDPQLLRDALELADRAIAINPDEAFFYTAPTMIYTLLEQLDKAEVSINRMVALAPDRSYFQLGLFYAQTNKVPEAIHAWERAVEIDPESREVLGNLVTASSRAGDSERVTEWATAALPLFERRLRLVPDDEHALEKYIGLLQYAGQEQRAQELGERLIAEKTLDGNSLFNLACTFGRMNNVATALELIRRAVAAGYRNVESLTSDPDLAALQDAQEFRELINELEAARKHA
jgi:adenylate cyclase